MRRVLVGTAGHIDHGKSALVRALTGTDPDRLPEEKARGITIDLGFAHAAWDETTFSFVDVPGTKSSSGRWSRAHRASTSSFSSSPRTTP